MSQTVHLSSEQGHAIELCADIHTRIAAVTGGAGTGKTLVLGHVYKELSQKHSVALCAPTGRAAKRIQELTGIKAKTIHKLLEFPNPGDEAVIIDSSDDDDAKDILVANEPKRCNSFPFDEQVIIVDESSMVGPELYGYLIAALQKKRGVIRFFGDNNQLLPVEEGDPPFRTILSKFPSVTLTYNFRSQDDIVSNAYRILHGRVPVRNDRFEVRYTETPILDLLKFVQQNPEFGDDDHQIIMPARKGAVGTARVNPSIQVKLNKRKELIRLPRFNEEENDLVVREDDKFLWVKNDYALSLFNGEIGRVQSINTEDGSLWIRTAEGRTLEVPPRLRTYNGYLRTMINYDPRKQLELGYAITTHKSQGSEFDTIIYCINRSNPFLLNRNNFYTAVTRARHKVIVICDRRAMGMSLRRERRDWT